MVNFLLNEKADIDYISVKSETALALAIQEKHIETARILLEHGANTAVQNAKGQTPLMSAVLTGEAEIVKLIFQHQKQESLTAELDTADFIGNTSLMVSADKGFLDITKFLLERGAKVESINRWNETALMFASSKGFREIVSLLLKHGADIDARDISEKTALLRAAQNGHLLTVEMLLLIGANMHFNAFDLGGEGGTALIQAARNGHNDVLQKLLNDGAEINSTELMFHHSALMVAALNGHLKSVKLLLNAGADPMLKDTSQRTALLLAATNNHLSVVKQLVDAKQNGKQTDSNGNGIWHLMAMSYGQKNTEVVSTEIVKKDKDNFNLMKELISQGISLDSINNDGETALIIAVKRENLELVKIMLNRGASPDIITPDGENALSLAETSGNIEVLNLLR